MKNKLGIVAGIVALAVSFQSVASVQLSKDEIDSLARERETSASFTAPVTLTTVGVAVIAAMIPVGVYFGYTIYANGKIRAKNGQFANKNYRKPLWQYLLGR